MATPLDEVGEKVTALKAEMTEVEDHWKERRDAIVADAKTWLKAHEGEAQKAAQFLAALTGQVATPLSPAEAVLARRTAIQKARAWLKKNWKTVAYFVIGGVVLFDVIF